MRNSATNATTPGARASHAILFDAIMAHLPPGSRTLTPCETTTDPKTGELRCTHKHMGKHLRTVPGATVTLLPTGQAHIVEPCSGRSEKHTATDTACDGGDPYVLWYVMAARAASGAPGTGGFACSAAAPYEQGPYSAQEPNPNNPDPIGAQSIMTRHWPAGLPVQYIVNVPPNVVPTVDIFAGALGAPYPWAAFKTEIATLMSGVNAISTANTPPAVGLTNYPLGMAVPNYNAAATAAAIAASTAGSTGIINASGQFIWASACNGGPTGNNLNEFIFVNSVALGAVTGDVVSMLLDVTTGDILECDVIYDAMAVPCYGSASQVRPTAGSPMASDTSGVSITPICILVAG